MLDFTICMPDIDTMAKDYKERLELSFKSMPKFANFDDFQFWAKKNNLDNPEVIDMVLKKNRERQQS